MKKNSSLSKRQQKDAKTRSKLSAIYILIAVVAIIECLVLISFTTFSWIETASSLIIKTGNKYLTDTYDTRIPISSPLNFRFIVGSSSASSFDSNLSDLNNYFSYSGESQTQNLYRFARASSADGKTFFFPKKTNLNPNATGYRQGDIIDSNAEFAHFDFVVNNKGAAKDHKLKFFFAESELFTVTNDTSNLSDEDLAIIKNAMRISFQSGNGTPKIYSAEESTYNAVNTTAGGTVSVTTTKIVSGDSLKLFTLGKNSEQNISVRIWLEDKAPDLSGISGTDLAGVDIKINLKLSYSENDYDFLYFDDYTLSSGKNNKVNIGGHLTGDYPEDNTHRMFFVYQESSNGSNRHVYPMTIDDSGSNVDANCWVTCDSSGNPASTLPDITGLMYITNLTDGTTNASKNALKYSYFGYGNYSLSNFATNGSTALPSTITYKWFLNDVKADTNSEMRYSAYSATSAQNGAGGWSYVTPLSMVYFRDLATGVTTNAYNNGANQNFKYITNAVNVASDTAASGSRSDVMYACTMADESAKATATLYYDKTADNGNGLFKSWVPTDWIENQYIKFSYCPGGSYSSSAITWTNSAKASKPSSSTDYIYTALGYSENNTAAAGNSRTGSGTWREIESDRVYLSTELIDNVSTSAQRYQIGVKLEGAYSYSYYTLIPDETNMSFYAYLPKAGTNTNPADDYNAGDIMFHRASAVGNETSDAIWLANLRKGSNTFYPVKIDNTATSSDYTRGYWNISVIVDGTYEHFFWNYGDVANENDDEVLGTFSYNTSGHGSSATYYNITPNMIDEYRWYVPLDGLETIPEYVYYRWEPYTGTVFTYSQKISDGIYCVITESADATPANAFS